MERSILVEIKEYYGRVTIVPLCDVGRKFASLLGQKTLTEINVRAIKALGYEIKVKEVKL